MRKGTPRHRVIGYAYTSAMILLNATSFWMYELYGRFGPFHGAAIASLATIAAGVVPAILRRPQTEWMSLHAYFMCWSYVGLVAAFIAEIAVRVPGVGFGQGVIGALIVTVAGGALLIHTRIPRLIPRVTARRAGLS